MRHILLLCLTLVFLLTVQRLPAPIVESDEKPAPAPAAKPRPAQKTQALPKPKPTAKVFPFAGVWTGTTSNIESNGATGTSSFNIVISPNGMATVRWILSQGGWSNPQFAHCVANGATASWTIQGTGDDGSHSQRTYTLTLTSSTTATFQGNVSWTSGPLQGLTAAQTGSLVRHTSAR
jgi:hypothetical protein